MRFNTPQGCGQRGGFKVLRTTAALHCWQLNRRMLDTAVVFAGLLAEGGAGEDASTLGRREEVGGMEGGGREAGEASKIGPG